MKYITFNKLVALAAVTASVALPVLAQQQNPVPGPYQVMIVPMTPRAMTPNNMDPRNAFPTYAPALPYWMQAPTQQAPATQPAQQAAPAVNPQQPIYAQPRTNAYPQQRGPNPQIRYLPPRGNGFQPQNGYQQNNGYAPNYGYNQNSGQNYGQNNNNGTWGMPNFGNGSPWGNNGNWMNFGPFSN